LSFIAQVQGGGLGEAPCVPSKITLVDLAGSERQSASTAFDRTRIGEASSINRSLTALGKVVQACVARGSAGDQSERGRTQHVPYRDSALTRLLSDSIGGQAKTLLVAHVTPLLEDVQERCRTLQFAANAARVQEATLSCNEEEDYRRQASRLLAENTRMRVELQAVQRGSSPPAKENQDPDGLIGCKKACGTPRDVQGSPISS